MQRRSVLATILVGLAAPTIAWPREPAGTSAFTLDRARIDAALRNMVAGGRATGASALIWQHGAERYFGATGEADREAHRPMRRDTLVQIFSMPSRSPASR